MKFIKKLSPEIASSLTVTGIAVLALIIGYFDLNNITILISMFFVFIMLLCLEEWIMKKKEKELFETGRKVYATYYGLSIQSHPRRDSYSILCTWINPTTQVKHYFKSDYYTIDISDRFQNKDVIVYLNEETGDYVVDLREYEQTIDGFFKFFTLY